MCLPLCENGACVATNTCLCTDGYIGDSCSTAGTTVTVYVASHLSGSKAYRLKPCDMVCISFLHCIFYSCI